MLGRLPQKAKARLGVGRFVGVEDDVALLALPNPIHCGRAEEVKADAERELSEHFGRPVRLRLVVDGADGPPASVPLATSPASATTTTSPPSATTRGPGATVLSPPEENFDLRELRDAPTPSLASPVDHVMRAFEGAELVED